MTDEDELWDEEREAMEHLQYLVQRKEQINALRDVRTQVDIRLEAQAALGSSGDAPETTSGPCANDRPPAEAAAEGEDDLSLWDEEVETQEHLRELAYWDESIHRVQQLLQPRDALPPTQGDGLTAGSNTE